MSVEQISDELAGVGNVELVGIIDRALADRPGLRLVRDDVLAVMHVGLGAEGVRAAITVGHGSGGIGQVGGAREITAQLRIEAEARARILGFEMLDASAVADYLGSSGANRRQAASGLRQGGKLLGIEDNGRVRYPAFQVDAGRARVRPIVVELNVRLDAKGDPWGVASWWLLPHARLADARSPAELAMTGQEDETLRALAQALIED